MEKKVVATLSRAWRRMMLIVLMPDSVMGRVSDERQPELGMIGAREAVGEHF